MASAGNAALPPAPISNTVYLDSCADLTQANTPYVLTADVVSDGICFRALAKDVKLDCRGHSISNSSWPGYAAIQSSQPRTTVKNCRISGYLNGLLLEGATGAKASNISINFTCDTNQTSYINSGAIRLAGSNSSSFSGISIYISEACFIQSLFVKDSSGNSFDSFSITYLPQFPLYPVLFHNASNNSLTNSSLALPSPNYGGIRLLESNGNKVEGISSNAGITLVISSQNTLARNNATAIVAGAGSNNNKILKNRLNGNPWETTLAFYYESDNNTIEGNALLSGECGVLCDSSTANNTFHWNNFTSGLEKYINDGGHNAYGRNISGRLEGNIYAKIFSGEAEVLGSVHSSYPGGPRWPGPFFIGEAGAAYPYRKNTSATMILGNAVDYAPLTPFYAPSSEGSAIR
ncbi:MAG: NosD domain-containing protein [Candidatus Micrarchaeia archaeon]